MSDVLGGYGDKIRSYSISERNLPHNITYLKSAAKCALWMCIGEPVTLIRRSLNHTLILLLHITIQMKMALIIEGKSSFMSLKKSVLHLSFVQAVSHLLKLSFVFMMLPG
jgi:hypothetical protein